MTQLKEHEEAQREFLRFFSQAIESGKWMALVCRVEGHRVHLDRVTWEFPIDLSPQALTQIVSDIKGLTPNEPEFPSLHVADFLSEIQEQKKSEVTIEPPMDEAPVPSQPGPSNDPESA